ncbi:hypothetical protein CLI64_27080 [Nostoc sp. CENA543]|uniref:hypothetical protein n=1 Tax=Nostoc sp. CENA543 TaxID=1869241 RepID=UPI000CA099A4|nr:hypothetical protein [Nostoc sp. CENA543]AUT03762.1 hypothetical protein CLI64_27080 [Nostoc sp. CENA543]
MRSRSSTTKLGYGILSSSSLAVILLGMGGNSASAQLTIQSTGTLSGNIQLPNFNPNFNNRVTRIDTDSNGTYYRNGNPIYQSNYVKMETAADGSLRYFVDFKGIPVISLDGVLSSPVLSKGELTGFTYQGKIADTKFQGVVQDEFGLTKAFYTGIVTDPSTGKQYQGTFQVSGQGPRYSDRNGGESPTVFDFKSDLPGQPTVTSLQMKNSPLVRLTITVPADATLVTPNTNTNTTNPTPTTNTSTTNSAPNTNTSTSQPSTNVSTPTPITSVTNSQPSTNVNTSQQPSQNITTTNLASNVDIGTSNIVSSDAQFSGTGSPGLVTPTPFAEANIEFSSGNPSVFALETVTPQSQVKVGPRSRIMVR